MVEEIMERIWLLVELWAGCSQSETPHPLLCPWNVCSAHHSHANSCSKDAASREQCVCCWDHLDCIHCWTPLRPLHKLSRFWWVMGGCRDLLIFLSPKISLICKFPSSLKLPPTSLEWSASFFCLSLPSAYGGPVSNFTLGTPKVSNQHIFIYLISSLDLKEKWPDNYVPALTPSLIGVTWLVWNFFLFFSHFP